MPVAGMTTLENAMLTEVPLMPRLAIRAVSMLLLIGALAAHAAIAAEGSGAWWNADWAFRKELTLDDSAAGANIADAATDVPVLVRLSIANFPYFADARPDGADLRFIADDGKTPLKFHIEKFDAQAQIALLWVQVPRINAAVGQRIYLYYGNPQAASAGDPAGTYDNRQALVYHFGGATQDSTASRNEPLPMTVEVSNTSLIGSGLHFDGANTLTVPASPSLRVTAEQGVTISAWVRPEGAQTQAVVASLGSQGRELSLGIDGDRAYARWRDGGRDAVVEQSQGGLDGQWHHVALRANASSLALFVDGVLAGQSAIDLAMIDGPLAVGGVGGAGFLRADLDELQVSGTARSDGWLRAAALSQGMVAPLVVYGGDAQNEGGGSEESYFSSTLRNVTFDGWVIIAVLSVMFLASLAIMLFKNFYLGSVARGNARFIADFHRTRDDPAALARGKPDEQGDRAYGASTLWRLYSDGIAEVMGRVDGRTVSASHVATLSPQSIEAIRATMDATQVRLTQRLQSKMVWLTISISGGPFLGLLGTVVGVMITFAAIAASGEVNVNAIAPGTAAALVATVAGLAVAIPCLFGYNYLNTRIKEITADMRVFIDEFVTRAAETYS
jgi:biopolymer transport protein ExbB